MSVKFALLGGACLLFLTTAPAPNAHSFPVFNLQTEYKTSSFVFVSRASRDEAAEAFISDMASEAIGFLGNGSLNTTQKASRFRTLLRSKFDMKTLGRFALGRYWRSASDAQKKEYRKLFEDMIVDVYSARFGEYQGQSVDVRSSRKDGERDVTVQSFIVPDSGPEIQVDWRLRKKDGRYRVIDVVVEGVSMAMTQRSEFSSVIQRGGGELAVLIDHMQSP